MLKDSCYMLISSVLRCLSGVFVFVVLARDWGAHQFGAFMYPFTISMFLVLLVDYGFTLQLVRDIPKNPGQVNRLVWEAFITKLLLTLLVMFGLAILMFCLPAGDGFSILLLLLTLAAAANSFGLLFNLPFRGLGSFQEETKTVTLSNLVHFVVVVAVVWMGYGPVIVAYAFLVSRLFYAFLSWRAYRRLVGKLEVRRPNYRKLLSLLGNGFPFAIHVALGTLYFQIDTVLIHHFLGAEGVGIYQAPMRVLIGGLILLDVVSNVYLPRLSRASDDKDALIKIGRQMTRYLTVLGVIGATVMITFAQPAVQFIFGSGYESAVRLMSPLAVVFFLRYFGGSYGAMLTVANRQSVRAVGVMLALIINVALNFTLIPRYGLNGAVAASVITHILLDAIYIAFASRQIHNLLLEARTIVLVAGFMVWGSAALFLPHGFTWVKPLLGLSVLVCCMLLGIRWEEWANLLDRASRLTQPGLRRSAS